MASYDFFRAILPNRLGNIELADAKCELLGRFQKLGPYSCKFTIEKDEKDVEKEEPTLDAKALDDYFRDHTQEQFHLAHVDASLLQDDQRDVFQKALMRPHVSAHLIAVRKDREAYKRAMQSSVFFIEGDARLLGMFQIRPGFFVDPQIRTVRTVRIVLDSHCPHSF